MSVIIGTMRGTSTKHSTHLAHYIITVIIGTMRGTSTHLAHYIITVIARITQGIRWSCNKEPQSVTLVTTNS